MDTSGDCNNPLNWISRTTAPEANSLVLNFEQNSRMLAISQSAERDVLLAQKRAAEVALSESQISSSKSLKRAHIEQQSLEEEKCALSVRLKTLERREEEYQENVNELKRKVEESEVNAQRRIDDFIKYQKEAEDTPMKVDELKNEISRLKIDLSRKEEIISEQVMELVNLRLDFKIAERKLSDLEKEKEDDRAALAEVADLKTKVFELEHENASLKDRITQATHAPGNASSLLSRPDGSGLFLRSSSILQSTRLEQKVAQLQSECAKLRRSEAELATAREELADLKAELERANQWRDRALLAEEQLTNKGASVSKESVLETQAALAQCQRENALLLSQLGQFRSELEAAVSDLRSERVKNTTLEAQAAQFNSQMDLAESQKRRLNRLLKITTQERDIYKQFVSSYEDADATLASPAGVMVHDFQQMIGEISNSLNEFYQSAESDKSELERLSDEVGRLLRGAQAVNPLSNSSADAIISSSDRETIHQLRVTISELEQRLETLENDKQTAELEVERLRACGAYNPDTTQVIHLVANPADMARRKQDEELVEFRKENALLMQRNRILSERILRLYETQPANRPDLADFEDEKKLAEDILNDNPDPLLEIKRLKGRLLAQERRELQLMERFQIASSELRSVAKDLFGYEIRVKPNLYKVIPLHGAISTVDESAKPFIKFARVDGRLVVKETTLPPEEAREFLHLRMPVPEALARYYLLKNTSSEEMTMEQSTMLM